MDIIRHSLNNGHIAIRSPFVSIMDADKAKRLFIGIGYQPGEPVRQLLKELQQLSRKSSSGLRPVAAQNLHLTLKFLGMIRESEIGMIRQVMEQTITRFPPFSLQIHGFGCFRQALWLGIRDCEALHKLAGTLDKALALVGVEKERKPYFPHLTVARLRPDASVGISGLQTSYGRRDWGAFEVSSVCLFESETLPAGARYTELYSVPLYR